MSRIETLGKVIKKSDDDTLPLCVRSTIAKAGQLGDMDTNTAADLQAQILERVSRGQKSVEITLSDVVGKL